MDHLETVAQFSDRVGAEMFRGYLEGHGIDAVVLGDDYGGNGPHLSFATQTFVKVRHEDLHEAKELYQIYEEDLRKPKLKEAPRESAKDFEKRAFLAAVVALIIPLVPVYFSFSYLLKAYQLDEELDIPFPKLLFIVFCNGISLYLAGLMLKGSLPF